MPPVRSETASVVSMPPREKRLAKRRARAVKLGLGLPPSVAIQSPNKQAHRRVPPTLAATRERRAGANRAYVDGPNGIRIKRVVRRPTPGPVLPVPYLPGQEDIPHSDDESDSFNHAITNIPATAEPQVSSNHFNVADEADGLLDYDAEGEDDDEYANMNMDMDIDDFSVGEDWGRSDTDSWNRPLPNQPIDLLANASEDDIQALFSGFDSLRFGEGPATAGEIDYLSGNFSAFNPPVAPVWNNIDGGAGSRSQVLDVHGSFTAHQVNATVNGPCTTSLPEAPSPPTAHSPLPRSSLPPLRRVPTPAPWVMTPEVQLPAPIPNRPNVHVPCRQPTPSLSARQGTPRASPSRAGTPFGRPSSLRGSPVFSRPRPPISTSERAAQIRSEAGPSGSHGAPPTPALPSPANIDLGLTESDSEGDNSNSDSDAEGASTPVELCDTDIGLTEASVVPAILTQAMCRAARWVNLKAHRPSPRSIVRNPPVVPTVLELRSNAKEYLLDVGRRTRTRDPNPTTQPSNGRGPLHAWELTPEQNKVMGPMEYHVYKDIMFVHPWPRDRDAFLEDAKTYAIRMTNADNEDAFTPRFMETVYSKMPANRGNPLPKIEVVVQQELSISAADKPEIDLYLKKDNFLYPTINRDENQKFRVHIIGSALLTILFECGKPIGRVFMEELCQPDDPRKCAEWHRKVRDRTARGKGIPPGLIAYAATLIHYALVKLEKGGSVQFQEIHFRGMWDQYLRALLKLKHLGQLRMDLLELVQNRYAEYWPGAERDEDDEGDEDSYPAW